MPSYERPVYRQEEKSLRDGLEIFRQHTPANTVATHAHFHGEVECIHVLSGSFYGSADDRPFELLPGDFLFFRAYTMHSIWSGPAADNCYDVYKIRPSFLLDYVVRGGGAQLTLPFELTSEPRRCLWRSQELEATDLPPLLAALCKEAEEQHTGWEVALRCLFARLLLSVLRIWEQEGALPDPEEQGGAASAIRQALTFIHTHYAEDITAADCCAYVHMSYSYFSRCFHSITGRSFKQYLNHTRLRHAERLLLTTTAPVTEVAAACGYNNLSYFIACFHEAKGCTPHRLRERGGYPNADLFAPPKH